MISKEDLRFFRCVIKQSQVNGSVHAGIEKLWISRPMEAFQSFTKIVSFITLRIGKYLIGNPE